MIPKNGTATNTQNANPAVVESEPVGGSKKGKTMQRFESTMKRNSVARKPRYFSGRGSPTSSICFFAPATVISSRFCHRENFRPLERWRVIRCDPVTSTSISAQVVTIVLLNFKNPCCQKTTLSGLRCTSHLSSFPPANRLLIDPTRKRPRVNPKRQNRMRTGWVPPTRKTPISTNDARRTKLKKNQTTGFLHRTPF